MLVIFWIPFFIGVTIETFLLIVVEKRFYRLYDEKLSENENIYLSQLDLTTQNLFCICEIIRRTLIFGIIISQFSGMFYKETFLAKMAISIYPATIWVALILKSNILGDIHIDKQIRICFEIIFVLSIAIWTMLISNYYQKNVEVIEQKVIEQTEKRKILYFCDISLIEDVTISGETQVGDLLPYKYVDENGYIYEEMALTDYSRSEPIKEGEVPYVEITSCYYYKEYEDYYTGLYWFSREHRWKEYIFHLPSNISLKNY